MASCCDGLLEWRKDGSRLPVNVDSRSHRHGHTDSTRVEESTTTTTFANFSSAEITSNRRLLHTLASLLGRIHISIWMFPGLRQPETKKFPRSTQAACWFIPRVFPGLPAGGCFISARWCKSMEAIGSNNVYDFSCKKLRRMLVSSSRQELNVWLIYGLEIKLDLNLFFSLSFWFIPFVYVLTILY